MNYEAENMKAQCAEQACDGNFTWKGVAIGSNGSGGYSSAGRIKGPAESQGSNRSGTSRILQERQYIDKNMVEQAQYTAEQRAYMLQQVGAEINCLRPVIVAVFKQLQDSIYRAMACQGFWDGDQRNFAAKVALVHSELSEALEANRKQIFRDDKVPNYTGEEAEAADVLIRMFDLAEGFELRLGEALVDKMLYNLGRSYKHDKQY